MAFLGFNRNNRNSDCPCNGCEEPERHVGCRAECPKWKPWLEVKEERDKKERDRESARYLSDAKRNEILRKQRSARRGKTWHRYDEK